MEMLFTNSPVATCLDVERILAPKQQDAKIVRNAPITDPTGCGH